MKAKLLKSCFVFGATTNVLPRKLTQVGLNDFLVLCVAKAWHTNARPCESTYNVEAKVKVFDREATTTFNAYLGECKKTIQ